MPSYRMHPRISLELGPGHARLWGDSLTFQRTASMGIPTVSWAPWVWWVADGPGALIAGFLQDFFTWTSLRCHWNNVVGISPQMAGAFSFAGADLFIWFHMYSIQIDDFSIQRLGMFLLLYFSTILDPFTSVPADAGSMIYVQARRLCGMRHLVGCIIWHIFDMETARRRWKPQRFNQGTSWYKVNLKDDKMDFPKDSRWMRWTNHIGSGNMLGKNNVKQNWVYSLTTGYNII